MPVAGGGELLGSAVLDAVVVDESGVGNAITAWLRRREALSHASTAENESRPTLDERFGH